MAEEDRGYASNLFRSRWPCQGRGVNRGLARKYQWTGFIKRISQVLVIAAGLSVVMVICLRWVPPPTSAFMIRRHIENVFEGKDKVHIRYNWVNLRAVSPEASLAVIAAEDQKFPNHFGFDVDSIYKAMDFNKKATRIRGASTITQQTAKNLFLWPGKNFLRKGLEAYFTVLLELFWSKKRILEVYLNIAEFGEGVYGISAAAETFFQKPPSMLSRRDAAIMAAVLPNPRKLNLRKPSSYLKSRTQWIEKQMEQLGASYLNRL